MNSDRDPTLLGDILVVDDTPDNLRVLSKMLTEQGYEVRKVISGELALKVARNAPPDLILLDILMSGLNGYEVCSLLKANVQTADIPIIFISALDDVFDKLKAFEVGGVDYITKPFQSAEVLARVKNQLTIRYLHRKLQQQNHFLEQQNELLQQEIEERQRAEAETSLLLKTTQAISSAEDFHSALEVTLRQVCETIGWDFGEAWIPSEDGTTLEQSQGGYALEEKLQKFRDRSQHLKFFPDVGLPGRVWTSKQPEWIVDITIQQDQLFSRVDIALEVGLKAALGIPIVLDRQVLAILVFFKKEKLKPSERLIELVNSIATQLASLIQRKKAESALKKVNLELERLATLDELTGVANRRQFNQYLNKEWRRLAREKQPLSLILCDIDYFKSYNDTYGHLAGDFCLQQVAQVISHTIKRPGDIVARYGGEEFVIILPNTHAEGALQVAENIRREVENLKIIHAESAVNNYITLSGGVASLVPQNQFVNSLLIAVADKALYEAKEQGRNRAIIKNFETLSSELLTNRIW